MARHMAGPHAQAQGELTQEDGQDPPGRGQDLPDC